MVHAFYASALERGSHLIDCSDSQSQSLNHDLRIVQVSFTPIMKQMLSRVQQEQHLFKLTLQCLARESLKHDLEFVHHNVLAKTEVGILYRELHFPMTLSSLFLLKAVLRDRRQRILIKYPVRTDFYSFLFPHANQVLEIMESTPRISTTTNILQPEFTSSGSQEDVAENGKLFENQIQLFSLA